MKEPIKETKEEIDSQLSVSEQVSNKPEAQKKEISAELESPKQTIVEEVNRKIEALDIKPKTMLDYEKHFMSMRGVPIHDNFLYGLSLYNQSTFKNDLFLKEVGDGILEAMKLLHKGYYQPLEAQECIKNAWSKLGNVQLRISSQRREIFAEPLELTRKAKNALDRKVNTDPHSLFGPEKAQMILLHRLGKAQQELNQKRR